MNRSLWSKPLSKTWAPAYTCPHCRRGTLKLQPQTIRFEETRASEREHAHEAWEPTWIDYVFSCWLKCTDTKCGHYVSISGKGGVEPTYDPEEGMEWVETFQPRFALPMPDIIDIPPKCPEGVTDELRRAFALFWADPSACANRIRSAIETLLDDIGIQRRRRAKGGYVNLTLHQRLEILAEGEPVHGANLLAVKWLGNTGSHGSTIDQSELLDAFEIIEHSLAEVVSKRSQRVAQLAKKMAHKHAPRRNGARRGSTPDK